MSTSVAPRRSLDFDLETDDANMRALHLLVQHLTPVQRCCFFLTGHIDVDIDRRAAGWDGGDDDIFTYRIATSRYSYFHVLSAHAFVTHQRVMADHPDGVYWVTRTWFPTSFGYTPWVPHHTGYDYDAMLASLLTLQSNPRDVISAACARESVPTEFFRHSFRQAQEDFRQYFDLINIQMR